MSEGSKFQVKLSARATAWVRFLAKGRTQSDVIREFVEERLFLFGLPLSACQRLQARADAQRLPLHALLANVLLEAALEFPSPAADTFPVIPPLEPPAPDHPPRRLR